MRRMLLLTLPWWALLACARPSSSGDDLGAFEPLLKRLPADADLVLLVDTAQAGRSFHALLARLEHTPWVAQNPGLQAIWRQQRGMLDAALAAAKTSLGFDPFADLTRLAAAVRIPQEGEPPLVVVAEGRFPPDLPGKLFPEARTESMGGQTVYRADIGPDAAVIEGRLLLLADRDSMPGCLAGGTDREALLNRHHGLRGVLPPGFISRLSFAPPAWLKAQADAGGRQPLISTLAELRSLRLDIGDELCLAAEASTDPAAESLQLMFEGWRDLMTGGQDLVRGYLLMVLGMDLQELPGLPPELRDALKNRSAAVASLREFFPAQTPAPRLNRSGRSLSLHASPEMAAGNASILGIAAAIAIPAFINYLRRSKESEALALLHSLKTAEEMHKAETGSYLACGPAPEGTPGDNPRPWPTTGEAAACFRKLNFQPPSSVYFTYRAEVTPDGGLRLEARGDLDEDGMPLIHSLSPDDPVPRRESPEGEW